LSPSSTARRIVAAHCSKFHAPYVAVLRLAVRAPIVVHLHNGAETADGPPSPRLQRLLQRCAVRVIAVSPAIADFARSCVPARAADVVAVPNGSDPTEFEWVTPEGSLQWGALRRVIALLRARGNEVLVVVGPFNEHLIAPQSRPGYQKLRSGIEGWLAQNRVPYIAAEVLPSALYADASHPLTDGYAMLAQRLCDAPAFQRWLKSETRD
jgi:glycosyltransferase involved in cell wall biosynthesis